LEEQNKNNNNKEKEIKKIVMDGILEELIV
jgi:hypothetical protein